MTTRRDGLAAPRNLRGAKPGEARRSFVTRARSLVVSRPRRRPSARFGDDEARQDQDQREEVEQFEGFIEDDHGKEGAKQRDGVR